MKKKILSIIALAAAFCGCNKEQLIDPEIQTPDATPQQATFFTATMESAPETRAIYDDTNKCASWEIGDQISVNGILYQADTAGTRTTFTEAIKEDIRPTFISGSPVTNTTQGVSPDKLVDADGTRSKWCDHVIAGGIHIIVSTGKSCILKSIKLWNGGDTASQSGRLWKDVKVYGSSSAEGPWDENALIQSFTNLELAANNNGFAGELPVNATKGYTYYKVEVLSTMGQSLQQMSDMKFVVTESSVTAPYDAFFPADLYDGTTAALPANITETWTDGQFNMPMYAHSENTNLLFKNLCGVLKVTVKSDRISEVKSIRVSSTNKAMSGEFSVNCNNAAVLANPDNTDNTVTVTYTKAVPATEEGTVFYVAIPAQTYRDLKIELSPDGTNFTKSMSTKADAEITVERSKIYPIDHTDAFLHIAGENCYIINTPGVPYTFPCKKGQSMDYIAGGKSVKVLWESFGTATAPASGDVVKSVSYDDGRITVTAGEKDGNAVVALYDGDGAILWSWHIWVCNGYDHLATARIYNNGDTVMDRNLGATSIAKDAVENRGLLYQWGRKDPFLASSAIASKTLAVSTNNGNWSEVATSAEIGTVSNSIKHPMTFIYGVSSSVFDWLFDARDNSLWGYDATTQKVSKSMYDPCPAGWRVPDGGADGLWSKAFDAKSYWASADNWDGTNRGMDFGDETSAVTTDKKLGSGMVWYPASGCRYNNNGKLGDVGSYGGYWSATPYSSGRAYGFGFFSNGYVDPAGTSNRAGGSNVRCVKE